MSEEPAVGSGEGGRGLTPVCTGPCCFAGYVSPRQDGALWTPPRWASTWSQHCHSDAASVASLLMNCVHSNVQWGNLYHLLPSGLGFEPLSITSERLQQRSLVQGSSCALFQCGQAERPAHTVSRRGIEGGGYAIVAAHYLIPHPR